jgi:hypothetical protein
MCAGTNRTKRKDRAERTNDNSDQSDGEKQASERRENDSMATADTDESGESIVSVGAGLAEQVNEFEGLDVSQIAFHEYRVLSVRNESITVHEVNVAGVSCTCQDNQYNREGQQVCAHVAKCLLVHQTEMNPSATAARDMRIQMDRIAQIKRDLEDMKNVQRRTEQANAQADADTSGDEEPSNGSTDPVTMAENFMERNGIDSTGFDISVHDQFGSVNIALDGCDDAERKEWKALAQETDGIMWDGDSLQNFIKEDRIGEVLA